MNRSVLRFLQAGLIGLGLGLSIGLTGVQGSLAFYGFWAGWMWLILAAATAAAFVARRQRGLRQAVLLGLGAGVGLFVTGGQAADMLGPDEYWFPAVLGALLGVVLSPLYLVLAKRLQTQKAGGDAAA